MYFYVTARRENVPAQSTRKCAWTHLLHSGIAPSTSEQQLTDSEDSVQELADYKSLKVPPASRNPLQFWKEHTPIRLQKAPFDGDGADSCLLRHHLSDGER